MVAGERVGTAVSGYLAAADGGSPSTLRAHRWALTDLARTFGDDGLAALVRAPGLQLWLTSPTGEGREPSAATVRQRAAAVRALLRQRVAAGALDPTVVEDATEALRQPATPAVERSTAGARLLLARSAGGRPYGVSRDVWVRFRAHVRVLAASGATERELARVRVVDVADAGDRLVVGDVDVALDDATRRALGDWLPLRASLVATLEGSPPPQLWVRVHPSVDPRTGAVAAVGMPITARGLRKAFTDVVGALAGEDPRLVGCTVAHVRALAARAADGSAAARAAGA